MKFCTLAAVLALAAPAYAQSDADLLLLLQLKAGVPPTAHVDYDRTAKFNELLRTQVSPAVEAPAKVGPAAVIPAKAPSIKTTPKVNSQAVGHYEWRTKYVRKCFGSYCKMVPAGRYQVWVADGFYPARGNLWRVTGSDVKSHLVREHGMDAAWVNTLSDLEARSVHSDAHDAERGNAAARSRLNQYARLR